MNPVTMTPRDQFGNPIPLGQHGNPLVYTLPMDYLYQPTYEWQRPVEFDVFWLVFPTFGPMTAGLAQQQAVNVPNDADFECREIRYHVDNAAAQQTFATAIIPNVTMQIQDSGSGRNLLNTPAPIGNVAFPENFPRVPLLWPKIFTRNSTITMTLTNFDAAAVTNNLRVTLAGRKIFSRG